MKSSSIPLLLFTILSGACAPGELLHAPVPSARAARSARIPELERAPDAATRAWEDAGRRALRSGLAVGSSFRELVRFPAAEPHAVGYRFALRRGQTLHVTVEPLDGAPAPAPDVFELVAGELYRPVRLESRGDEAVIVARADAQYVLRIQPPPGSGGLFAVTVRGERPLLFPVSGADAGAIRSWFGDARDRGARAHEGIDIFAPRGTPAVAAARGIVTSTRPTPAGGNVVWIEDEAGGLTCYYAHLDEQWVQEGDRVAAGDTVGTVGNTGNARGVSPHLHFAVYLPGRVPVDPAPLLANPSPLGDPVTDPAVLGRWTRLDADQVRLRAAPSLAGAILAELRANTPLFVLGGVSDWYRVVLRDGTSGFIAARYAALAQDDGR